MEARQGAPRPRVRDQEILLVLPVVGLAVSAGPPEEMSRVADRPGLPQRWPLRTNWYR